MFFKVAGKTVFPALSFLMSYKKKKGLYYKKAGASISVHAYGFSYRKQKFSIK